MKSHGSDVGELLPWDTEFFGCRIGRACGHSMTDQLAAKIDFWAAANQLRGLYFLARSEDAETIRVAESHDFKMVDVRVTLETELRPKGTKSLTVELDHRVRPFESRDVPVLCELAANEHAGTRFYNDLHFPRAKARQFYSVWIERECAGKAKQVFVAVSESKVIQGYVSCRLPAEGKGEIGLIAVASDARGNGVGKALVLTAMEWFRVNRAWSIEVVTQMSNIAAQRLYQRAGFLIKNAQFWFHKWYAPQDGI